MTFEQLETRKKELIGKLKEINKFGRVDISFFRNKDGTACHSITQELDEVNALLRQRQECGITKRTQEPAQQGASR